MLRQHTAAKWIDLAERHGPEAVRPFQAKAEPADTREEIEDFHHSASFQSALKLGPSSSSLDFRRRRRIASGVTQATTPHDCNSAFRRSAASRVSNVSR
jgi:hypothetical protein